MAFRSVAFLILALSVVQSYSVQVPVYMWGDLQKTSPKSNPLATISTGDFTDLVGDELEQDPLTVVFVEETLSVEDFSRKNSYGESAYPFLHSIIGGARYISAVEEPLTALTKLSESENVDHVKLNENGLSAEIEPQGKYLFINLKDAREGETRHELLRRHNDFMQDMYGKLKDRYSKVIAIYTAYNPSWTLPEQHRVRRQAEQAQPEQAQAEQAQAEQAPAQLSRNFSYDGLNVYLEKAVLFIGNDSANLTAPETGITSVVNETQTTTLVFTGNETSHNLSLNFILKSGYWWFDKVAVNVPEKVMMNATKEVYAPLGFSYACMQNIVFKTNETTEKDKKSYNITFINMRIQPFFTTNKTEGFGDPYYCVGFFTSPIWAGLFVVFILLAITFFGITMIMDIRTMDRFDDPKGKTITINAVE